MNFSSENNSINCTPTLMLSVLISQMKELGVIFYNCSCLVLDLQRIFALYSSLKFKSRVPQTWSKRLYGVYDNEKKLQLQLNETKSQAFVSVSRAPFFAATFPNFCPPKAMFTGLSDSFRLPFIAQPHNLFLSVSSS